MSEDERARISQTEEQDDVEAHRKATAAANDEGSGQSEGDEDFEAHRRLINRPGKGGV